MSLPDNFSFLPKGTMAGLLLLMGGVIDGLGMVIAFAVGNASFFENAVVWIGIAHMLFCAVVAGWIVFGDWSWKAQHFGYFSLSILGPGYFMSCSYLTLALHSSAPYSIRLMMILVLVVGYGRCFYRVFNQYQRGMKRAEIREIIYQNEPTFFRYSQRADAAIREKRLNVHLEPSAWSIFAALLVCGGIFVFRHELSRIFGVGLFPLWISAGGLVVGSMFISAAGMIYFVFFFFPALLKDSAGKPVYVDLDSNPLAKTRKKRT